MQQGQLTSLLLALLDSVLLPRSCAYVAGPLESGRTYYEQAAAGRKDPLMRVMNQQRLAQFVERLRATLLYPVFDPGVLKVDGWTNAEHGAFFIQVLERFAKEVWFLDGWEFSHGATKEFIHSCKSGIPCRTESGELVDLEKGKLMIRRAADYVETLGLDGSRLRDRTL